MSPEGIATLVTSVSALVAVVGRTLIDLNQKRNEAAREKAKQDAADAKAEADRILARDKTQEEHSEWLRETVESQIKIARADRDREREECNQRIDGQQRQIDTLIAHVEERDTVIDSLRREIEGIRDLAERLLKLVAQIDPYKTPTPAQMDAMRETATKMGLRPSLVPSLVIAKGVAK